MLKKLFVLLSAMLLLSCSSRWVNQYDIKYTVSGTATSVNLKYTDPNLSVVQTATVSLPWTYSFSLNDKAYHSFYVQATIVDATGTPSVTVDVGSTLEWSSGESEARDMATSTVTGPGLSTTTGADVWRTGDI